MRYNLSYEGCLICAVAIVMLLIGSTVYAGYQDVFVSSDNPDDPYYSPGAEMWSWPVGWTGITLPKQYIIAPGGSLWLGLENIQQPEPWIKTVTLEFWSAGVVPVAFKAGNQDGTTKTWSMELVDSTTTYRKWVGTIQPQPGWEWVELRNQLSTEQTINITNLTSSCVPEPATICLLGFGGLLLRRRKSA